MSQDNSQLDITDRQLLVGSPQPASVWTEIGDAQITHTLFGKAKVRIIRKNDNLHRALWLVVMVAAAAVAWQAWLAFKPAKPLQSEDSLPHVIPDVQDAAPATPADNTATPAQPPSMDSTSTAPHTEAVKPVIVEKAEMKVIQPQPVAKAAPIRRPLPPKPSIVVKPQQAPVATESPTADHTGEPLPPRQPGTPYIGAPRPSLPGAKPLTSRPAAVAAPRTQQRIQPAASSPAEVMPLSSPVMREETPAQSPAGNAPQPAQPGSTGY